MSDFDSHLISLVASSSIFLKFLYVINREIHTQNDTPTKHLSGKSQIKLVQMITLFKANVNSASRPECSRTILYENYKIRKSLGNVDQVQLLNPCKIKPCITLKTYINYSKWLYSQRKKCLINILFFLSHSIISIHNIISVFFIVHVS